MFYLNNLFIVLFSIGTLGQSTFLHAKSSGLEVVESKKVCMVNDRYFGVDQIPVQVGSQTYYGCCHNCEKTLKEQASSRFAIDPVTKNKVDKAKAVIGKAEAGGVFYFESMDSLKKYNLTLAKDF